MGIRSAAQRSENVVDAQLKATRKIPVIDLTTCTKCGGCIEVAPDIFQLNEAGDYVEVCERSVYDEELVDEAIKICPEDAISWEES